MRRVCHILGKVSDRCGAFPEEKQAVWDALGAYSIVMSLDNPKEIYQRMFSAGDVSDKLKSDLHRLWIGPDIEADDPSPVTQV